MKLKIVSDGTNAGTHLVDEDTGEYLHKISKISWEADVSDFITKTTVEFTNIPVEIVSKAEVELVEHNPPDFIPIHTKTFEKEVKIATDQNKPGTVPHVKIYDNQTGKVVGAIQKVKWEATPHERGAKLIKIKFDKKDW